MEKILVVIVTQFTDHSLCTETELPQNGCHHIRNDATATLDHVGMMLV